MMNNKDNKNIGDDEFLENGDAKTEKQIGEGDNLQSEISYELGARVNRSADKKRGDDNRSTSNSNIILDLVGLYNDGKEHFTDTGNLKDPKKFVDWISSSSANILNNQAQRLDQKYNDAVNLDDQLDYGWGRDNYTDLANILRDIPSVYDDVFENESKSALPKAYESLRGGKEFLALDAVNNLGNSYFGKVNDRASRGIEKSKQDLENAQGEGDKDKIARAQKQLEFYEKKLQENERNKEDFQEGVKGGRGGLSRGRGYAKVSQKAQQGSRTPTSGAKSSEPVSSGKAMAGGLAAGAAGGVAGKKLDRSFDKRKGELLSRAEAAEQSGNQAEAEKLKKKADTTEGYKEALRGEKGGDGIKDTIKGDTKKDLQKAMALPSGDPHEKMQATIRTARRAGSIAVTILDWASFIAILTGAGAPMGFLGYLIVIFCVVFFRLKSYGPWYFFKWLLIPIAIGIVAMIIGLVNIISLAQGWVADNFESVADNKSESAFMLTPSNSSDSSIYSFGGIYFGYGDGDAKYLFNINPGSGKRVQFEGYSTPNCSDDGFFPCDTQNYLPPLPIHILFGLGDELLDSNGEDYLVNGMPGSESSYIYYTPYPQYSLKNNFNALPTSGTGLSSVHYIIDAFNLSNINLLNPDLDPLLLRDKSNLRNMSESYFYHWFVEDEWYTDYFNAPKSRQKLFDPSDLERDFYEPKWSPMAGDIAFTELPTLKGDIGTMSPINPDQYSISQEGVPNHVEIVENVFFYEYKRTGLVGTGNPGNKLAETSKSEVIDKNSVCCGAWGDKDGNGDIDGCYIDTVDWEDAYREYDSDILEYVELQPPENMCQPASYRGNINTDPMIYGDDWDGGWCWNTKWQWTDPSDGSLHYQELSDVGFPVYYPAICTANARDYCFGTSFDCTGGNWEEFGENINTEGYATCWVVKDATAEFCPDCYVEPGLADTQAVPGDNAVNTVHDMVVDRTEQVEVCGTGSGRYETRTYYKLIDPDGSPAKLINTNLGSPESGNWGYSMNGSNYYGRMCVWNVLKAQRMSVYTVGESPRLDFGGLVRRYEVQAESGEVASPISGIGNVILSPFTQIHWNGYYDNGGTEPEKINVGEWDVRDPILEGLRIGDTNPANSAFLKEYIFTPKNEPLDEYNFQEGNIRSLNFGENINDLTGMHQLFVNDGGIKFQCLRTQEVTANQYPGTKFIASSDEGRKIVESNVKRVTPPVEETQISRTRLGTNIWANGLPEGSIYKTAGWLPNTINPATVDDHYYRIWERTPVADWVEAVPGGEGVTCSDNSNSSTCSFDDGANIRSDDRGPKAGNTSPYEIPMTYPMPTNIAALISDERQYHILDFEWGAQWNIDSMLPPPRINDDLNMQAECRIDGFWEADPKEWYGSEIIPIGWGRVSDENPSVEFTQGVYCSGIGNFCPGGDMIPQEFTPQCFQRCIIDPAYGSGSGEVGNSGYDPDLEGLGECRTDNSCEEITSLQMCGDFDQQLQAFLHATNAHEGGSYGSTAVNWAGQTPSRVCDVSYSGGKLSISTKSGKDQCWIALGGSQVMNFNWSTWCSRSGVSSKYCGNGLEGDALIQYFINNGYISTNGETDYNGNLILNFNIPKEAQDQIALNEFKLKYEWLSNSQPIPGKSPWALLSAFWYAGNQWNLWYTAPGTINTPKTSCEVSADVIRIMMDILLKGYDINGDGILNPKEDFMPVQGCNLPEPYPGN